MNADEESQTPDLKLRPESTADATFLFALYASTRETELDVTGWDESTRHAFLQLQHQCQREGYRGMFPSADFSIVILDRRPIGRMVVDRTGQEIRIVDLALLTEVRGRGIGSRLVKCLLLEAARAGKRARLQAIKNSRQAAFYERLGFSKTGETGLHDDFVWEPTCGPSSESSSK